MTLFILFFYYKYLLHLSNLRFLQLTVLQFLERHTDHRNLNGIYTDVFLCCLRQEIFGGNL